MTQKGDEVGLKSCCLKYSRGAQPKVEKKNVFEEVHSCPTCGQKMKITFQEISALGEGLSEFEVIGVDVIELSI